MIDQERAIELALEVLRAEGRDADGCDVSVTDDGEEWEVAIVGKHPRAPGDEVYVYVHKASGATRTMYGE